MNRVWLIRHGESQANAGFLTSNPAQIPLTHRGVEQAKSISGYIKQSPSLIIVSPYLRAQQTADPTIERYSTIKKLIWPVQEFTYLSPNRCQNTTVEDRRPMVEAYWENADPKYIDGEGAESFCSLMERVDILVKKLQLYKNEFIVIFSHGQFIQALIWLLLVGSIEQAVDRMLQFRAFSKERPLRNGAIIKIMLS